MSNHVIFCAKLKICKQDAYKIQNMVFVRCCLKYITARFAVRVYNKQCLFIGVIALGGVLIQQTLRNPALLLWKINPFHLPDIC